MPTLEPAAEDLFSNRIVEMDIVKINCSEIDGMKSRALAATVTGCFPAYAGRCLWLIAVMTSLFTGVSAADEDMAVSSVAPPLSPEDSIATMKIQEGYQVVPVLTEPQIHEPAAIAWDGNGRLYVVEMRTYMQEIDGKDQLAPTSRVSRHEDTNGDGVYDKHTIFADNLALPRMVLPLLDQVIIRETNTLDLKSYRDTDGDGVADEVQVWHEGGPRGGNLEHQPSGLIWNIDNYLYTTYSPHRYRYTGGQVVREAMPHGAGQWGLTHDDEGRLFYSSAGGENPATDFQRPPIYGRLSLSGEQAPGFREVFPIDNVPDTQGGRGRLRADNTLNHFTASCGQSIYRGNQMPSDWYGDLIICEPVGRLIRRARVRNDRGRVIVENAYHQSEFIASTDPNFRPINSATGPDGCLYIVDMYRGIIQEGNWVRDGSYLRGVVQEYELDKNIGRGRIYRIEHEGRTTSEQPRMLDETAVQLVRHLGHANGWWRSEAQKLIVLHGDKSVVPHLNRLLSNSENPLERLHAIWTLEGLDAVSSDALEAAFADSDPRVRSAALRISEASLAEARQLDASVEKLAVDNDPNVAIQVMLSATRGGHPAAEQLTKKVELAHAGNEAIASIAEQIRARQQAMLAERRKLEELRRRNRVLAEAVVRGKATYNTLCITCHGPDGKGKVSPDNPDLMLAPPLAGSQRVLGHKERLTRILLNGLIGPVDGKTYSAGLMLPMGANDDRWISDVATYIRNEWGNKAGLIEDVDVQRIRTASEGRIGPWTLSELEYFDPPELRQRSEWKLTASHNLNNVRSSIDGNPGSRWDTGTVQKPGMWFQIELPEPTRVFSATLNTRGSDFDYPRGYVVTVSSGGETWSAPVAEDSGDDPLTHIEIDFPDPITHVRIEQTGMSPNKYWSIHELALHGTTLPPPSASLAQLLAEENVEKLASDARRLGNAKRGAALFYDQTLSCAKCHDPSSGSRLGPDLSAARDGVNDRFLVESVLEPSKSIRKGFESLIVETEDGAIITGFRVSETDDQLVIREPAGGKVIELAQEDVYEVYPGKVSAMPPGLVNQLRSREDFLHLARFLMEIYEGGPDRLQELRKE